jgi:hypothetical protein
MKGKDLKELNKLMAKSTNLQVIQLNNVGLTSKTFNSLVSFDDMDEASSIGAVESGVQVWCTSSNSSSQIASDVLCVSIRLRVLQLYLRGNHFGGATEKRPPSFVAALVVLKPAVLDVSNCDLGAEGLAALAVALLPCVESGTLRSLAVGVNVKAGKSAARAGVAIAALLDHELEQSKLRSLNIEGQEDPPFFLKDAISPILSALASNSTLQELVISGNRAGDDGGRQLGAALETNTSLELLQWDRNGTGLAGFQAFLLGLENCSSLTGMHLPVVDLKKAASKLSKADKVRSAQHTRPASCTDVCISLTGVAGCSC